MSAPAVITLRDVTLGYDRHPAVHHLTTAVRPGTLTAVVGPNGAGKSTLLKGIMGLLKPLSGDIVLSGGGRREIAYLPQQADIDREFPISVADFVAMGLWRLAGPFGAIGRQGRRDADAALAAVGLGGFRTRSIGSLSGGQMQRLLFARLLLQDAPVILLDEPFTAIDSRTSRDLMDVVLDWHGAGRTILAVLHDLEQVRTHFPDTLLLAREAVAEGPTADVLTDANLHRARRMAEAFDDTAVICRRPAENEGEDKNRAETGWAA